MAGAEDLVPDRIAPHGAERSSRTSPEQRRRQTRALSIALGANAAFLLVEIAGGLAFNSLALIADAAHMLSDVAGLAIAVVAQVLVTRPITDRHTYGYQRAEVLAAQVNGLILLIASGWIIYEAIGRLRSPVGVNGGGLAAIALLGLGVNIGSAVVVGRSGSSTINIRGALIHLLSDAASSAGAVVAGIGIVITGAVWLDPTISILIALLVIWSALGLLRDAANVLLEAAPRGMSTAEVEAAINADDRVDAVHHLHIWNLASDVPALSAHIVIGGETSLHEAQIEGNRLRAMLEDRFGITHATLELECHQCEEPDS